MDLPKEIADKFPKNLDLDSLEEKTRNLIRWQNTEVLLMGL